MKKKYELSEEFYYSDIGPYFFILVMGVAIGNVFNLTRIQIILLFLIFFLLFVLSNIRKKEGEEDGN